MKLRDVLIPFAALIGTSATPAAASAVDGGFAQAGNGHRQGGAVQSAGWPGSAAGLIFDSVGTDGPNEAASIPDVAHSLAADGAAWVLTGPARSQPAARNQPRQAWSGAMQLAVDQSSVGRWEASASDFSGWFAAALRSRETAPNAIFSAMAGNTSDGLLPLLLLEGRSASQSVPEPAPFGLVLFGLGLMGCHARYRRRSTAAALRG